MYRVKLPFGLGHLAPSAILYAVPSKETPFIRRDGVMVRDESTFEVEESSPVKLGDQYQLLFGTEKIYLFLRLYSLLCSILTDTREYCETHPPPEDPTNSYITSKISPLPKKEHERLTFSGLLVPLQKVLSGDMSARDFETLGRKVSKEKVYQISALPKLIERCMDAMVKVAEEDTLLHLYDHCRFSEDVDPVALRAQCLSIVPDAAYRIQFDRSTGKIRCCYLPRDEKLLTSPRDDPVDQREEEMTGETDDDLMTMDEDPIEEFDDMNGATEMPDAKRIKVS